MTRNKDGAHADGGAACRAVGDVRRAGQYHVAEIIITVKRALDEAAVLQGDAQQSVEALRDELLRCVLVVVTIGGDGVLLLGRLMMMTGTVVAIVVVVVVVVAALFLRLHGRLVVSSSNGCGLYQQLFVHHLRR